MTLCIAANVKDLSGDAIVCCFDFRIETQTSGSNTGYKFRKVSDDWAAMLAGSTSKADRLLDLFVQEFEGKDIKRKDAIKEIRKVVAIYRLELVEEYIQSVLSISYREFRTSKSQIPDTTFQDVFNQIVGMRHGCDLILFNVKYKCPFLYSVDENGNTDQFRNFVAIGTGATNAEAWLHFREQRSDDTIDKTLAALYEAKKFAENAPGVGKTTRLLVIQNDQVRILAITAPADEMWETYGPKPLVPNIVTGKIFPDGGFMPLEWQSITI
jgi:20S proteasome alpha/beta subunit